MKAATQTTTRRLKAMKLAKKASKAEKIELLKRAGVVDKKGKLAKRYRSAS